MQIPLESVAAMPVWVYAAAGLILVAIAVIVFWLLKKPRKNVEEEDRASTPPTAPVVPVKPVVQPPAPPRPRRRPPTEVIAPEPSEPDLWLEPVSPDSGLSPTQLAAETLVGADSGNHICIVRDEFVSSRHARLTYGHGRLSVEDTDSTNGTFVNEVRIHTPAPLSPGDSVRFGHTSFRVIRKRVHVAR